MFATNAVPLKSLLSDVAAGKIQLPDFQRGWVWDDDRIRGLLSSISRGFPIGAIMTLEAGSDIRFKTRPIEGASETAINAPDAFLLDGQQRLTSLYQALLHDGSVETQDSRGRKIKRWYYVDMLRAMNPDIDRDDAIISLPENRTTTRDFGRTIELDLSDREKEYKNHMMPTERVLDAMSWMIGYIVHWSDSPVEHPECKVTVFAEKFNQSIANTFAEYLLPVIRLTKDTPKEAVCTVFEKVNTGGVTLNVFELVTASFAVDDFSLRDDWSVRRERLCEYSGVLQDLQGEQFLQAITLMATQEKQRQARQDGRTGRQIPGIGCKKRDILNLTLSEYELWADKVESGFKDAAKFLTSQFVFRRRDVPYSTQLIPLAALFVELGNELESFNAKEKLERWYWSGVFGESYGGAVESQFALDLTEVANYVRTGVEPSLVTEASFIPERLLSLRTRNSAAYKGLYALQMKNGASDWFTGESLTVAGMFDSDIDIHHIFPKAWCKQEAKPPIPPRIYNSVINKTPIDASTNRKIGGRSPSRYLPMLQRSGIDEEKLDQVLISHWVNPELLRAGNFGAYFVNRGEAMLELIGAAMGKRIQGGREAFRTALNSAGYYDEYDDGEEEYDAIGEIAYDTAADD